MPLLKRGLCSRCHVSFTAGLSGASGSVSRGLLGRVPPGLSSPPCPLSLGDWATWSQRVWPASRPKTPSRWWTQSPPSPKQACRPKHHEDIFALTQTRMPAGTSCCSCACRCPALCPTASGLRSSPSRADGTSSLLSWGPRCGDSGPQSCSAGTRPRFEEQVTSDYSSAEFIVLA